MDFFSATILLCSISLPRQFTRRKLYNRYECRVVFWVNQTIKIYTKFTLTDLNLVRYCFAQAKSFSDGFQCFALCLKSHIDIMSTLRWSVDTQGWLLRGYWITAYYCLLCAHLFFDQMLLLCIWCQATKITLPSHCGGRARHSDWDENILIMVVYNKIFS